MADAIPSSPRSLDHSRISQALLASTDDGQTLDFSNQSIDEIRDEEAQELAVIGKQDDDDEGCVTRIALVYNRLKALPTSFSLISRLRYLNLKANLFTVFPDVLTNIPSLEILEMSRNRLTSLPERPGTLKNLRVLSLSKNKLERLPSYIADFNRLKMLKLDSNPIQWPPPHVLRVGNAPDGEEQMQHWITELRDWMKSQFEDTLSTYPNRSDSNPDNRVQQHQPEVDLSEESQSAVKERHQPFQFGAHSRGPSNDSIFSTPHTSTAENSNHFREDRQPPPYSSLPNTSFSSSQNHHNNSSNGHSETVTRDAALLNGNHVHGRNASYSAAGTYSNGMNPNLLSKKSLPDMRSHHMNGFMDRKGGGRRFNEPMRRLTEEPPLPQTFSSSGYHSTSERQPSSRPATGRTPSNSQVAGPAPPMDAERNSYFKRLSTLPSSTISKTIPDALLKTIDNVRGVLFAVSQMYTAIRHYTVFGIDDRLSGVLGRVLDPASAYMGRLINALDRFDSMSRRGLPPPAVCRALLENCRDNVAIFGKVVGVLQAQLKVLAGTDDVRYSRTLLLMLYGAMGEISNSWNAMAPHLEAIQPLLYDYRPPPASKSHATSSNRSNITPILESPGDTGNPSRIMNGPPSPSKIRAARRNAGSFSHKDVQLGRSLATSIHPPGDVSPPASTTSSTTVTSTNAGGSRSTTRGHPDDPEADNWSPPLDSATFASSSTAHSRENSLASLQNGSTPARNGTTGRNPVAISPAPHLIRSHTTDLPASSQLVDRDLLSTMEIATETAQTVWSLTMDVLNERGDQGQPELRETIAKAQVITDRLRDDIQSIRDGYLVSDKKALSEDAHLFAKIVVQIFSMIKTMSTTHPLPSSLRNHVVKLAQATKDFTILLHVSSFSPATPRPFSPAFPPPGTDGEDGRGNMSLLGRSRSATATQQAGSKLAGSSLKDVPWSAQPHQSFKVPALPTDRSRSDTETNHHPTRRF